MNASANAIIYKRRNGYYGSMCDGTADTGHDIHEDGGRFTVWSVHEGVGQICNSVNRAVAEEAITADWRKSVAP
jgi:hypothetical protein